MWHNKTVSVILPTYNEKDSIRAFIKSLESLGIVDEIVVVNNNAAAGTSEEVAQTSAIEVFEPVQGYGASMQKGLAAAKGELLVVFEPDGTFFANDTWKLLSYSDDFDAVYGTRTSRVLIWHGANMGPFLKWGNVAVAKLMEVLFNTTCLSDVGCTARCITRSALAEIQPYFTIKGNFFGPEMMLLSFMKKQKVVQIAVNYTKRIGSSSATGNKFVAFQLGIKMIHLVLKCRFQTWFHRHPMQRESS